MLNKIVIVEGASNIKTMLFTEIIFNNNFSDTNNNN